MRKKLKSLKSLHKKCWTLISLYVRQNGMDWQGFNYCFTCGTRLHYKQLQCGHYIHNKLDYELDNLKPQCSGCNKWRHGNLGIYGEKLIRLIGLKKVEKLRLYAFKKGNDYNRKELESIIKKYQRDGANETFA